MLHPLKWLFGLNRLLGRMESFLLVLLLIVMLIFASLQVILRNFFDTGVDWGDVFARHLVLWVAFFGATLSTMEGRHIRIDALLNVISKRWQPPVEVLSCLFCIIISGLLTHAATKFMLGEKMSASILFENVPTWYFMVIMPLGFALITFRFVVHLMELLLKFSGKKIPTTTGGEGLEISVNLKLK